jgi:hypothetical protein
MDRASRATLSLFAPPLPPLLAPMPLRMWWLWVVLALWVTGGRGAPPGTSGGPPGAGAGPSSSSSGGVRGEISPKCPLLADAVSGRTTSPVVVGEGMASSWCRPHTLERQSPFPIGTASDCSSFGLQTHRIALAPVCGLFKKACPSVCELRQSSWSSGRGGYTGGDRYEKADG